MRLYAKESILTILLSGQLVAGDFHLARVFFTGNKPSGFEWLSLDYLPSNKYTCAWLNSNGFGKGTAVVPNGSESFPDSFTALNPICGEANLKFKKNSSRYDLTQSNGEYVGSCYDNSKGNGLSCYGFGWAQIVMEKWICYTYLCK